MNRPWLLTVLLLAGCLPADDKAAAVIYDTSYTLEIVLDSTDGITSPDGLWWNEGTLYIADEGGSAVRRWSGGLVETLADSTSGIASPEDLVVDAKGQVWFTDDTAGGLWLISSEGTRQVVGSKEISESEGIVMLADGTLLVGDGKGGKITSFPPNSAVPIPFDGDWQVTKPESMALMRDKTLWLADNRDNRLVRIGPDHKAHEWPLPPDLSPETIASDGERLWIADSDNGRLYRLDPNGTVEIVALFLADFANINGVAIDTVGAVYVSIQSDLAAGKGYIVRLVPKSGRKVTQ